MPMAGELYYRVHESGSPSRPPLVLIHNLGGSSLDWPAEIRRLAGGDVFALDLPGHGKSEGAGLQSISAYAESVAAFLNTLALKGALVVGHGMGGAIALELAVRHRPLLAGLCVLNSGASLPIPADILENAAHASSRPIAVRELVARMTGPQTEAVLLQSLTERLLEIRPSLLHADLLACDSFDIHRQIKRIRLPVLVIGGTHDRFAPPAYSQALARSLPKAALQMIDGAGHLAPWEQPRRIATVLAVFASTTTPQATRLGRRSQGTSG